MPWYVLYTKPRNEKKAAKLLEEQNVIVYCPLQESIRQWSDRKKRISEPVFRSYVFVHLDNYKQESIPVLSTPGVVRFLWWQGKPGIVQEKEIRAIRDFLETYSSAPGGISVRRGDEVTIMAGALQEQSGEVIRISGKKAILRLKTLGLELTAELPVEVLKRNNQADK